MTRAERRREEREKQKNTAVFTMTREEIQKIREQEYQRARKEILEKSNDTAEEIFKMMIVIPTNVLIEYYWPKTAKTRIPKFVDDCMGLYDSYEKGAVDINEMIEVTEKYAGIKLIDDGSVTDKTLKNRK